LQMLFNNQCPSFCIDCRYKSITAKQLHYRHTRYGATSEPFILPLHVCILL